MESDNDRYQGIGQDDGTLDNTSTERVYIKEHKSMIKASQMRFSLTQREPVHNKEDNRGSKSQLGMKYEDNLSQTLKVVSPIQHSFGQTT